MMHPTRLTCEFRTAPRGIDAARPRLSWCLEAEERGQVQTAYQILVASSPGNLDGGRADIWDSGEVRSSDSVGIVYGGPALSLGQECWWKVRVWDKDGQSSDSEAALWQMGLLSASDWQGQWISAPTPRDVTLDDLTLPPCPYLRKSFTAAKSVARATLFATARGVYELTLNGSRVSNAVLAPGWTDYTRRIAYQTYDVTDQILSGENALSAALGDGWYCGYVGFGNERNHYGDTPQLLLQLNIEYADGSQDSVVSDGSWQGATGPILYSDMLMGEWYDARREPTDWQPVQTAARDHVALVPQDDPPVRVTEELTPRAITEPTPGTFLFDLGQNMVGWARLTVEGPAGTEVRLRFAEILNPDGTLYTTNLRAAKQTDTYILRGGGVETWEPRFTFHGFRYVEVTGLPGTPTLDAITGCVVHSDTPPAGTFECSNGLVNQLQRNIVWGQRGNFLSIPTDCPQRDERLGWMGDAQIFVRTATCNMDVHPFFVKWMQDVEDAQTPDGGFPDVAPRLGGLPHFGPVGTGSPAWGDAGVIVPWTIYQVYGDAEILRRHYAAMAQWITFLHTANPNLLWTERVGHDYGDWLSIAADTPKDVLATAYFAYDVSLMARIADVLGHADDAQKYRQLFADIKAAFNAAFVTNDGRIKGDTQTCYVIALRFDLLPAPLRPLAAKHLVDDIASKGGHLSTGFVGVGYLCPTLTEAGYNDVAYQLLLNETFPSWGYSIRHGATTIWERWDGWTEEKGFQDPGMNSFNHYSLGSVGEWLYRYVAGIDTDPAHPGFAHILIHPHPHPGPGLTHARAEYQSIRGRIVSEWKKDSGVLTLDVSIPANTTATVFLPAGEAATTTEGGHAIADDAGVSFLRREGEAAVYEVPSGTYRFEVR